MGKEKVVRYRRRKEESYRVSKMRRDWKEVFRSRDGEERTRTVIQFPVSPQSETTSRRIPSTKYLNPDSIMTNTQCERSCNTGDTN